MNRKTSARRSNAPPSPEVEADISDEADDTVDLTSIERGEDRRPSAPPKSRKNKNRKTAVQKKTKKTKIDLLDVPDLDPEALGAADFISSSLLAFPAPKKELDEDTRTRAAAAIALFNGVVWFERSYYFKMMTTPPPLATAVNWIADIAALDHISAFNPKRVRGLGKAGTRTASQAKAAREYGQRLLDSIQPDSLIAFTDGASKGNPGPCGAGAYVYDNLATPWDQEDSAALGRGTNNLGELWAIGMAMQIALRRVSAHPGSYKRFLIFTDSQFSVGILTKGWKSKARPNLASKLRLLFRDFPIPISIEWVPAHVGIDSNERADELADRGAKKSAKTGADVDPASDYATNDFQPRRDL
jgi:ribonuclease HI